MPSEITGNILNIQHFCVDDGPGIRTTVFLKGCPLRCAWCHNPESQKPHRQLLFRAEKCVGCQLCQSACPAGVHTFPNGSHAVDRDLCRFCDNCAKTCLPQALEIAGKEITLPELMEEILLDRVFYHRSGGGVTLSGGEPLAQAAFSQKLLQACKIEKLHTCVETCGYGKPEDILNIAQYTDLFLFDYKLTDPAEHAHFTGVSNATILDNLDLICRHGAQVILRCPMIPEVNMHTAHYDAIAHIAQTYPNIPEIHLEAYHPLGIDKTHALGKQAAYDRAEFLDKEELLPVEAYIRQMTTVAVKIL